MRAARTLVILAAAFAPAVALAQRAPRAFELPWSDVAPRVEGALVRTAAVAAPDPRVGRFSPRRATARSAGRARAIAALHAWADGALAALHADPRAAQAIHDAIDRGARVEGVRPLADGGAVVVVVVPLEALRAASASRGASELQGAPWSR